MDYYAKSFMSITENLQEYEDILYKYDRTSQVLFSLYSMTLIVEHDIET